MEKKLLNADETRLNGTSFLQHTRRYDGDNLTKFENPRFRFLILAALTAILLFSTLHRGGLSGYDDALYAHEGKEMLRGGNWWTIKFNGGYKYEYPPGFIWLEAASMAVFGVNDFAAKFPCALAGLGTILVLYALVLELTADAWLAIASMLVLATTQMFVKYSGHAMTDVPFTFFFTLALLLYLRGFRYKWLWVGAGLSVAFAILIRSLIGFLPLAIIGGDLIWSRRWRLLFSPQTLAGFAVALIPPLIWGASQYRIHGDDFLYEHLAFVAGKVSVAGEWHPSLRMFEYGKVLLKYYWPWLPILIAGIVFQVRAKESSKLSLIWFALVILPLSAADVKYTRYLMPAFPAMAILSGVALIRLIPNAKRIVSFKGACAVVAGVVIYSIAAGPYERATEMKTLAPVAERFTAPTDGVVLYIHGAEEYDYQNQFLWYGNRYSDLITDSGKLAARLNGPGGVTAILDRESFEKLPSKLAQGLQVRAETTNFICVTRA